MSADHATGVAILGGGQLARMLVQAGVPLGLRFQVADQTRAVCAGDVARVVELDWADRDAIQALAKSVDVVTFDWENVPSACVAWMAGQAQVHPNARALATAQDRLHEKALFESVGLPVAAHAAVSCRTDLDTALAAVGAPAILKTRRFGYDGKGQFRLRSVADVDAAWATLGEAAAGHGLILEAMVGFERELSLLAVRGRDGEFRAWPLVQNWHLEGILSLSLAPAAVSPAMQRRAQEHARAVAEALDYVGVLAIEFFAVGDELVGNEMAPRVHNSGHWSIEGAVTSQFENHMRAVAGLPLGSTALRGASLMFNWIGQMPDRERALAHADVHWHDYGKSARPGRKVGHATVCAADYPQLLQRARALATDLDCAERLQAVEPWLA